MYGNIGPAFWNMDPRRVSYKFQDHCAITVFQINIGKVVHAISRHIKYDKYVAIKHFARSVYEYETSKNITTLVSWEVVNMDSNKRMLHLYNSNGWSIGYTKQCCNPWQQPKDGQVRQRSVPHPPGSEKSPAATSGSRTNFSASSATPGSLAAPVAGFPTFGLPHVVGPYIARFTSKDNQQLAIQLQMLGGEYLPLHCLHLHDLVSIKSQFVRFC